MALRRDLFATVTSEGGILPTDLLARIAALDKGLVGLRPEDYHLAPGEKLNEAINRSWNRLQGAWAGFKSACEMLPPDDPGTTLTRKAWLLVLFQELGYGRLSPAQPIAIEDQSYPISHAWQHVPIHLLGVRVDLGMRTRGVRGAAGAAPHSMVQECLNRTDKHLWAFLSNGLRLRLLRDNRSLTRIAYVEFDLEQLFNEELYADFALLWLVCHESRVDAEKPSGCWLERWSKVAEQEGVRAIERLRLGVEKAIVSLGEGFLAHPTNQVLRERLKTNALKDQDYYRQLLRLTYRLLFLMVAEARDVLLLPDNGDIDTTAARDRYQRHYSVERLKQLADRRPGTAHGDLFQGLRLVMRLLGTSGFAPLALPALGSFLWSDDAIPDLIDAEIANRHLLAAIRALAYTEDGKIRRPVDYRNLDSDELGSVYEALLELGPEVDAATAHFALSTVSGSERKTTGSYYTPTSLVNCLLDTALDPVLDRAARQSEPEMAILALKVCDPACGSGHFLIAAAHRIAKRLAAIRTAEAEPEPGAVRSALRDVVARCLYGVDANEMAVELCKINLWLEAMEAGRPLSFLDHHIKRGNSLIGTTPALMAEGIPDDAFVILTGDEKETLKAIKKRNRDERSARQGGQGALFISTGAGYVPNEAVAYLHEVVEAMRNLNCRTENDVSDVVRKAEIYEDLRASSGFAALKEQADAWCAAFVWPKYPNAPAPITDGVFSNFPDRVNAVDSTTRGEVRRLADQYEFFHWHLEFPEIFEGEGAAGGFDVVLGNPPWERVKLQEQEFFASTPAIAQAPNAAARKRLIAALPVANPTLWAEWEEACRKAEGQSHFIRQTGRFPLCGKGDVNTYAVFAEHNRTILSANGRAGFVVPPGLATDDTTKAYFQSLVETSSLVSLYEFENEEFLFPGIDHRVRFIAITVAGIAGHDMPADISFSNRQVANLANPERHFSLSSIDFATLNPNTRTCPTFRSQRDAEINLALYRRAGVLWREGDPDGNPWGLRFLRMLDMANDSGLFHTQAELEAAGWNRVGNRYERDGQRMLPLIEAKMVHHYDHRFGTYEGQTESQANQGKLPELDDVAHADQGCLTIPKYWVAESEIQQRLAGKWEQNWLLGWRDICRSTDQRTVIASLMPCAAVGHTFPLALPAANFRLVASLYANLCSFAFDYSARQKIGGTHLTYHILKQLPVIAPTAYEAEAPWSSETTIRDWLLARVLELTFTARDLEPFARDCGYDGEAFRWDSDRRFILRAEIDAAFFHLYGLSREDASYILDTFPVVAKNEERTYGEFRTKRKILETYDALSDAISSRRPYRSSLDQPIDIAERVVKPTFDSTAWRDGDLAKRPGLTEEQFAYVVLAEVVRCLGGPVDSEHVRRAVRMVRYPALLHAYLDERQTLVWERFVGDEAIRRPANVVPFARRQSAAEDQAWGDAERELISTGAILEDRSNGTWTASGKLVPAGLQWIEGRVSFALAVLPQEDSQVAEQRLAAYIQRVEHGTTNRVVS